MVHIHDTETGKKYQQSILSDWDNDADIALLDTKPANVPVEMESSNEDTDV